MSYIRATSRDSNIELLRIVCMLFILIHHFIVHAIYPGLAIRNGNLDNYRIACIIINGFAYVGVNCFILISGYYGIKFKFRSLFNLYCICVFYSLLITLIKGSLTDLQFGKSLLYTVFLPFSHSSWWFIKCYVALYLISPILNKAAQGLSNKEYIFSIILLTVLNIYFGYYWHLHNIDGYNLIQFIYVYLLGAFLNKFPIPQLNKKRSMLLYLACVSFWSFFTVLSVKWKVPHWVAFQYNNPFVLLAAIGLFCFFKQLSIKNYTINLLASSVLAAYLIQDVPGVYSLAHTYDTLFIEPSQNEAFKIVSMTAFVISASFFVLIASFIIDRFRLFLMKPIWLLYGYGTRLFNSFLEKILISRPNGFN